MNALVEKQLPEKPPLWSTGPSVTALFEAERAEVEEEEDDEEEDEEDKGDRYFNKKIYNLIKEEYINYINYLLF